MLDLDHFKSINDNHGHQVGDGVLREIGWILRKSLRDDDIPARYGGEEFAVLLRGTPLDVAHKIAERIRSLTESYRFNRHKKPLHVTLSLGLGVLGEEENPERFLQRIDTALYQAKRKGRNRIVLAKSSDLESTRP